MSTEIEVYLTKILDSLPDNDERHGTPLSREKLQEEVRRFMEDNVNDITMDNLFHYPVTTFMQKL